MKQVSKFQGFKVSKFRLRLRYYCVFESWFFTALAAADGRGRLSLREEIWRPHFALRETA